MDRRSELRLQRAWDVIAVAMAVRTTAKSAALLDSARRAVWVKSWEGDHMSRSWLCELPFEVSLLFGPGLDLVLSRPAEKETQTEGGGNGEK